MKKFFIIFVCSFILTHSASAQMSTGGMGGFRRGVATVMFAGLGGAVLGLSTLSFYGEPQDHIGNIWTGLAVGALAGAGYVLAQGQRSASTAFEMAAPQQPKMVARSFPIFQYQWEF